MQFSGLIDRFRQYFDTPKGVKMAMWLVYFAYWAGMAAALQYIGVYYESVNVRGAEIGQLNSIRSFMLFLAAFCFPFYRMC